MHRPIKSLRPESGEIHPTAKTPSSDCLTATQPDPLVEALRAATFTDPTLTYVKLTSDEARSYVRCLLDDAQKNESHTATLRSDVSAVQIHRLRAGNFPCLVVELPAPQAAGQPHFAGLLVTLPLRTQPAKLLPAQVRYFTLEKRGDDADDQATVFCEWTARGERRSFGSGPAPRIDRFLFALSGMAR